MAPASTNTIEISEMRGANDLSARASEGRTSDAWQRLKAAECRYARARALQAELRRQFEVISFTCAGFPAAVAAALNRLVAADEQCRIALQEIAELLRPAD
jgi:hypothetical protein